MTVWQLCVPDFYHNSDAHLFDFDLHSRVVFVRCIEVIARQKAPIIDAKRISYPVDIWLHPVGKISPISTVVFRVKVHHQQYVASLSDLRSRA